jgi:flagellar operon protein
MNKVYPTIQRPIITPGPAQVQKNNNLANQPVNRDGTVNRGSFAQLLEQELDKGEGIKFSKHAEQRLETRNIRLSEQQLQDISQAVSRAQQKGVRDSLILMQDMAFIVNVPSRVVVTAMDGTKDNIFTNIDGAVIL